jgi:hypothetical protein
MKPKVCDKSMTFQECELAILRLAVDSAEKKMGRRVVSSEDIKKMITILENFIKRKNLICYGGTAINNILPKEYQFYDKNVEIPDYDFFTKNSLDDAKELANIYYSEGFTDVEAKSGQHFGTCKVFVNFIPVADLTQLPKEIFDALYKESIRVAGILYAPSNFLRMSMYLELSRPVGDTSRWEKVLKRLTLLNKHHPMTQINCNDIDYQREMENKDKEDIIYENVKNTLINQGVVFFGGFALSLYSRYMPKQTQKKLQKIADFDVLSNEPETTAEIIKERLKDIDVKNVKIIKHDPVGEIVPVHYEVRVGNDSIVFIYKPIACHSYNVIFINKQKIKIATIDTMLSFYLAFLYTNRAYFNDFSDRILCITKFLFEVQQKNRLEQKGLLKRFSITCYGHQESLEEMRSEKAKKFRELKGKRGTREYEEWFLNYRQDENEKGTSEKVTDTETHIDEKKQNKKSKSKSKSKTKKTQKNKFNFNFWGKRKTKKKKHEIY